jgi:hypothetical protein
LAAKSAPDFNPQRALHGFLCELLIGYRRSQRGERISGKAFIKQYAFYNLMKLLCHYLPADNKQKLDNLDPFRRFEIVFPQLGQEINAALLLDNEDCAQALLAIADRELKDRMPNYPNITAKLIKTFTT